MKISDLEAQGYPTFKMRIQFIPLPGSGETLFLMALEIRFPDGEVLFQPWKRESGEDLIIQVLDPGEEIDPDLEACGREGESDLSNPTSFLDKEVVKALKAGCKLMEVWASNHPGYGPAGPGSYQNP